AKGLAELVEGSRWNSRHADQPFVDKGRALERDRLRRSDSARDEQQQRRSSMDLSDPHIALQWAFLRNDSEAGLREVLRAMTTTPGASPRPGGKHDYVSLM